MVGKRAGLAGERSGLFFEFVRILGALAPRWVLIENVPGLFSSAGGRDFGTVLKELVQLGYGVAWRVLDARYFNVAQRRERVFLVGCLGDPACAAKVLFEPESCSGDSSPRREEKPDVAASLRSRSAKPGVNEPGRGGEDDSNLIAYCLKGTHRGIEQGHNGNFVTQELASTIGTRAGDVTNNDGKKGKPKNLIVTHTLRAEGCDASEDGTGRGTPLIVQTLQGHHQRNCPDDPLVGPIMSSDGGMGTPDRINELVGYDVRNNRVTKDKTHAIQRGSHGQSLNTVPLVFQDSGASHWSERRPTLPASDDNGSNQAVTVGSAVRRLTPLECERLQGFPDGWTAGEKDTTRYKMLGNAVCVNVAEWIGRRIMEAS